ncbi:MAG: PAS domain S-box protein, partial [Acidobacteria bacterium]|nr:PAS domain S-box protein [Acidobacteriota bacterium]
AYHEIDRQGAFLHVTRAGWATPGFQSASEVLGHTIFEFVAPEEVELSRDRFTRKIAGEMPLEPYTRTILRRDGRRLVVEIRQRAIPCEGGGLAGLRSVLLDITERQRVQALYAAQSQVVEMIATGAPLGDVMQAICRNLETQLPGAISSILLLNPARSTLHLLAGAGLPAAYNAAIEGMATGPEACSCGTAVCRRDAVVVEDIATDPLWANFRDLALLHGLRACWSKPVFSRTGEVLGTFAVYWREPRGPAAQEWEMIEVSAHVASIAIERHQAEETRERLAAILEATPDAVGIADRDCRPVYLNASGRKLLSLAPDQSLDSINLIDFHPGPTGRRIKEEAVPAVLRDGVWSGEGMVLAAGGRETPVAQMLLAIPGQNEAKYLACVLRDLTQQKRLEAELRQAQKMEAVGQLAGGVAHDFNNILTVVLGYAQALLNGNPPGDPQHEALSEIVKAADRAASLTRQLLAFGRRQILRPRVLDLNSVVADMDRLLRRVIGENIELVTVMQPHLGRVRADPGQIEQVLMNLAVNARDAMPKGGKLSLETAHAELGQDAPSLLDCPPGRYVLLSVSDTGHGMDQPTRERAFEPFFTTKEVGKGTGMGLATVYGIVKQSGGAIGLESQLGAGATFRIYLPRVEDAQETIAESTAGRPEVSLTILLLEDEPDLRRMICRMLGMQGHKVLEAADFASAREHCLGPGKIDLLLTDVVMPGMGGRDVANQVRQLRPEVRTLYMSGYSEDVLLREGIGGGGLVFLEKPFSPSQLAAKIREALR